MGIVCVRITGMVMVNKGGQNSAGGAHQQKNNKVSDSQHEQKKDGPADMLFVEPKIKNQGSEHSGYVG